ncbi:MAG TPA: VanZ family protein [Steroidobacteraceae bacterium]|jgi:VanZ family protein
MLSLPHARIWLTLGWLLIAGVVIGELLPGVPSLGLKISDKLEHFASYMVLMLWFSGLYERKRHALLALAFFLMGCALELLQGAFTDTRDMDIKDALANGAGIVAGFVLAGFGVANWTRLIEKFWTRHLRPRPEYQEPD